MPRTTKTDPFDSPCWVKGCNNVAGKYRICDTHQRQVTTYEDSMRRMVEHLDLTHRLRKKHEREVLRAARAAGLTIQPRASYAALDKLADDGVLTPFQPTAQPEASKAWRALA